MEQFENIAHNFLLSYDFDKNPLLRKVHLLYIGWLVRRRYNVKIDNYTEEEIGEIMDQRMNDYLCVLNDLIVKSGIDTLDEDGKGMFTHYCGLKLGEFMKASFMETLDIYKGKGWAQVPDDAAEQVGTDLIELAQNLIVFCIMTPEYFEDFTIEELEEILMQ